MGNSREYRNIIPVQYIPLFPASPQKGCARSHKSNFPVPDDFLHGGGEEAQARCAGGKAVSIKSIMFIIVSIKIMNKSWV